MTTPIEPQGDGDKSTLVGLADPAAIIVGVPSDVVVTTVPTGVVTSAVGLFRLDGDTRMKIGELVDGGSNGDLAAGDGAFSTTVSLTSPGPAIRLQLGRVVGGATVRSPEFTVAVVPMGFPTTLAASDTSSTVTDPVTGDRFVVDEVLLTFADETAFADIAAAVEAGGGRLVGQLPGLGTWQVRIPPVTSKQALDTALAKFSEQRHVLDTEANGVNAEFAVTPDDALFARQWSMTKTRADETWVVTRGRAVTVAVIDTGVGPHVDLNGKILPGWNHVAGNDDTADDHGHGTHVAGIIAANTNNAAGVAGVCWNCRILPEKVLGSTGTGTNAQVAAGIRHAVSRGAQVLNLSLGGGLRNELTVKALSEAYKANRVVVASAGNSNSDVKSYPGAYHNETFTSSVGKSIDVRTYYVPNLTVAATGPEDRRAVWPAFGPNAASNFGPWVDVAAPGTDILSTCRRPNLGAYCSASGTSMSAPLVAGAAAILRSEHPDWTEAQVRERLLLTAKKLSDTDIGAGRLDVFNAVENAGFDTGTFDQWQTSGTTRVVRSVGPVEPGDGSRFMAVAGTGPGAAEVTSTVSKQFRVLPDSGDLMLRLTCNVVAEEYAPSEVSMFNGDMSAAVVTATGKQLPIVFDAGSHATRKAMAWVLMAGVPADTTGRTPISGIDVPRDVDVPGEVDIPGGDSNTGQSGWRTGSVTIPSADLNEVNTFTLVITVKPDSNSESVVLLDDLRFR